MARLNSCGFELQSTTIESNSIEGSPTISTSIFRSGAAALKIGSLVSGTRQGFVLRIGASADGPYFCRAYLYVVAFPSGNNRIARLTGGAGASLGIELASDGTLRLKDEADNLVGTSTLHLVPRVWYRIEVKYDATGGAGAMIERLYVDGTEVAGSATISNALHTVSTWEVGGNLFGETQTQGEWYWDDVAVNDSTGSFQNDLPGAGSIIHLYPNGEGDGDTLVTRGGTDSGTNYGQMDEVTPNDATDYLALTDDTSAFWVDVEAASGKGMKRGDKTVLVGVGMRLALAAAGTATCIPRLQSKSAGVELVGPTLDISSTTWSTFEDSTDLQHIQLYAYEDPEASGLKWTVDRLDSMQIGVKTTDATPDLWISTIWALVEFNPAGPMFRGS